MDPRANPSTRPVRRERPPAAAGWREEANLRRDAVDGVLAGLVAEHATAAVLWTGGRGRLAFRTCAHRDPDLREALADHLSRPGRTAAAAAVAAERRAPAPGAVEVLDPRKGGGDPWLTELPEPFPSAPSVLVGLDAGGKRHGLLLLGGLRASGELDAEQRSALVGDGRRLATALAGEGVEMRGAFDVAVEALRRAGDAVVGTSPLGRITLWNDAAASLYGWPAAEVVGRTYNDVLELRSPGGGRLDPLARLVGRDGWRGSCLVRRKDGRLVPAELSIEPVRGLDGRVKGYLGISPSAPPGDEAREVADTPPNERLGAILDASPVPTLALDLECRIQLVTPAAERLLGRSAEDALGERLELRERDRDGDLLAAILPELERGRAVRGVEGVYENPERGRCHVSVSAAPIPGPDGEPVGFMSVIQDLTERRRLEEQLRQAHKLEAVGRLAGGLAHDFNNLITGITGLAELVMAGMEERDPLRADILEIERSAERAAALTRQLLAFSKQQVMEPRVVDAGEIVAGLERLVRRMIPAHIDLVLERTEEPCAVVVDPGQLEQVVLNLVVNAADAMPSGGRLTLSVEVADGPAEGPAAGAGEEAAQHVAVGVRDTGVGMDPETVERVFEPFFTTKEEGKGTGLGLSTGYGIVSQSGGTIDVESEPGEGTLFTVRLPRVRGGAESAAEAGGAAPAGGSERILLAEDEPQVRTLLDRVLSQRGYEVVVARNGAEALGLFRAGDAPVHLVLTDIVMPLMGGRELARAVRSEIPGVPVLYVTGYRADEEVPRDLDEREFVVHKPFSPRAIAARVREILDAVGEG